MDNRHVYKSRDFALRWHKHQLEKEDILRTKIMNLLLFRHAGKLENKIVLEAGCGNGFFLKYLLKLNPKQLFAFDISPHFIDICRKQFPLVDYKTADIMSKIPYKDEFFDVVFSYNVLSELPEINTAVMEMQRVTKKQGILHVIIVHPLYNLFVNGKQVEKETVFKKLGRYTKQEPVFVDTLPGYDKFLIYRRPIADYVNEFIKSNLTIEKMIEVPVSSKVVQINKKYKQREGIPVFAYFKLRR